jgi:hypothetical protein
VNPSPARFLQQVDRVRAVARHFPGGMRLARALIAQAFACFIELNPGRMGDKQRVCFI